MAKTTVSLAQKMPDSLGGSTPEAVKADVETRITYPTLWLNEIKGIEKLPDEFTAVVKFKKTRSSEEKTMQDGVEKETCSATLEVHSIEFEPVAGEDDDEDDAPSEDTAESALDGFLGSRQSS